MAATTIYVRLAASATGGAVSGNVTVASTGASSVNVAVSGRVNSAVALTFGPQDFEANNVPFVTYSVAGSQNWNYVTNSTLGNGVTTNSVTNKTMEVNGFGSDVAANDWLILGPIDATTANNPVVTFNTLTRFTNNAVNELTLKVSTNYSGTGSPATATWTTLTYNVPATNTITKTASGQVALTGAANQNNVYVAWHFQAGGTTTGTSGLWQVDDVTVQNALKPALLISAPGVLNEGVTSDGTGTVSIPLALASDLEITVTSSDATELLVYTGANSGATSTVVTIPAGQTSATFSLETLADDLIDADQSVTLTASVGDNSYDSATATVSVKNLDVPSASLGSSGYTQDFSGFAQATPTLPTGWSVSGPVTTFNTSTNSSGVLTDVDWGSGTGAGLRGNGSVLGYQHTSSTGTLIKTLVLKNTGTEAITALTISYKGRATRLTETRIPIYTVTVNGTANSALAYSTAEGDLKLKSAVITGLDIQPNKTITISWSSDRGGTAGSARQIGISEVSVQLGANLTAPTLGVTSVNTGTLAQTTADVSGSVSGDGGAEVTERGFVYAATSANADPLVGGTDVTKVADASGGTGSFSAALTGLTANTGYSLKAYAINGQGTSYSSLVTFTTLPTPPTFSGTYTQNFTGFSNMATLPIGWTALSSAGVNNYVGEFSSGSSTGGFYGSTNTPGVLGYLHTSSTGTVTNKLTLINGTGAELTSLYVSYKGRVEATNNTRIPIMTVKVNGATVAELEYSTASGVDESKSTQVTGLSIADGTQFTVTWEHDRGLSSGNSRRIGLTDVRVATTPGPAAPSNLSYSPSTINGFVGQPISSLTPTVTGTVDTYSINPSLPTGLSINPTSGVISGTPLVTASSTYTVTAANAGGSATTGVTIQVSKGTPIIVVPPTAPALTVGASLSSSTLTGGSASVAGTFAWTDGTIVPSATGSYGVTFTPTDTANYNTATTTVSLTVNGADPLADYMTSFGLSGPDAAGDADPDKDGQDNNAELAFGTDPTNGTSRAATLATGTGTIKLVYLQRNSGVTYTVKSFTDLSTPFDSGGSPVTPTATSPQPAGVRTGYTQYEASLSTGSSKGFLRVKAVR